MVRNQEESRREVGLSNCSVSTVAPLLLAWARPTLRSSMAILRQLSIAVLAVAFVAAVATQMIMPAWPMTMTPNPAPMSAAGMSEHAGGPVAPCKTRTPICVDHVGCVIVVALPASPMAMGVPIRWRTVSYDLPMSHFAGQSVAPELSPPILTI